VAEEERRRSRRRKSAEGRRKTSRWLPLSLVRIWVRGEAETPSVGGGEAGGGSSWWLKWQGERGKEKLQKCGQMGWFLANFGPDFLLPQVMKCDPIYRRWKRRIFSLMVPNRGLWFGW
jgi:hypothetical protein